MTGSLDSSAPFNKKWFGGRVALFTWRHPCCLSRPAQHHALVGSTAVFPNFKTFASCTYWQGKSLENITRIHFLEILDFLSNLWTTIWKRVLCLLISLDLSHYLVLHRYIMCNPQDLGCDCVNPHDTRYYPERLLVYDRHPGGIGISVQVWP